VLVVVAVVTVAAAVFKHQSSATTLGANCSSGKTSSRTNSDWIVMLLLSTRKRSTAELLLFSVYRLSDVMAVSISRHPPLSISRHSGSGSVVTVQYNCSDSTRKRNVCITATISGNSIFSSACTCVITTVAAQIMVRSSAQLQRQNG
jgi:hypothetical protein